MDIVLEYRRRQVTATDVEFIRKLIAAHPKASRRALSQKLCEAWDWRQANGSLRDMVCRSLMLELHRAGHIELPPVHQRPRNNLARRSKPVPVEVDDTPIRTTLRALGPLSIRQVRRTAEEPLLNGLIEMHHYLGYTQPVGEHLKYLVYAGTRPVACFTWSSAPRHLGPRDRYLGWSMEARRRNIRFVAYNSRFLILPWVEVPHLASHLLGRMTRMLPSAWEQVYGHPVHFAETFVYPAKFLGTCYRAANWVFLGRTTGRGKDDLTHRANRPVKDVLGYPLTKRFRELLRRLP
jgi:Druantia protein DruA